MRLADPTLEQTLFPDRWHIGGVPVRQMELGHALLLQRIGSPFAGPVLPAELPWSECLLATWVCSRGWKAAAKGIDGWRMRLWTRLLSWVWTRTGIADAVMGDLRIWHASAWIAPEAEPEEGGRTLGADFLHLLLLHRRQEFGERDAEALSMPILRARLDLIVDCERKGALRLVGKTYDEVEEYERQNAEEFRQVLRTGRVSG